MPDDFVYRPQLVEQLERGRHLPLTLVSAPAGYGKSCQVSSWLETCRCPAVWLALDQNDNQLGTFLLYFVAAVQTIYPSALGETYAALNAATLPPPHELATTLTNELDGIEEDFILVLDDFHNIRDRSILDIFDELLCHPPRNPHFVLIGRKDPFLPIARLRARGQITELRVLNLRFVTEETAAFLRHALRHEVPQTTVEAWTERTEGWVSGLRLAALSMQHLRDAESVLAELPRDSEYVGEYLFNELVSQQSPVIQDFLLKVSIVDRFCSPLCDTICHPAGGSKQEQATSSEIISGLKRDNLFIINLDQEGRWFRFHHMFRKVLATQMEHRFSSKEIAELQSRASSWFAENDFTEEAILLALSAGEPDRAVGLVEEKRHDNRGQDRWFVRERWLSLFSEEVIHQHPELLLARMWLALPHFDLAAIPALAAEVNRLLDAAPRDPSLRGEVEFFMGLVPFWQNDAAISLSHLENALKMVPESYWELRGDTEVYYGLASQMQGGKQGAISRLDDLLHKHRNDKGLLRTRLLGALVYIHIIAGDLPDALIAHRLLHDVATKNNYAYAEAWSSYLRGLIHYYQNDLDQAIIDFEEMIAQKYALQARAAIDGMAGLALAYQAKGQNQRARATVDGLLDYIVPFSDPAFSVIARSCQTRLAIVEGRLDSATAWLQQPPPPSGNMVFWMDVPSVTYCRALLAEGSSASIESSVSWLEELLQLNQTNHNVCQPIQIMPLLALAYESQGRLDAAFELLEKALVLARPGGWIRPFVELGPPMADLLNQLPKKSRNADQINTILDAIGDDEQSVAPPTSGQARGPVLREIPKVTSPLDYLTYREQEVLRLLAQRQYNKEIADTLSVSIETVKTHVKHVFQKLEVSSRREAIARADALGLLAGRLNDS
ncbi:MAG: LuxR C-terminal-related transcriptional regulator [Armatimonadota bacterium]